MSYFNASDHFVYKDALELRSGDLVYGVSSFYDFEIVISIKEHERDKCNHVVNTLYCDGSLSSFLMREYGTVKVLNV